MIETVCGEVITYADEATLDTNETLEGLRQDYGTGEGRHWFDDDTLAWFGSSDLDVAVAGFTVERQTNAPEGVPEWKVTAWFTGEDGKPYPSGGCRHDTRAEAYACAEATSKTGGLS
jgi:hypothetical protein